MAFSTQRATSDGTMETLIVSIGYIKQADISVFYDDLPAADGTWEWVGNTNVIAFTPTVPLGVEVLLKRTTQINQVINVFTGGAGFSNKALDTNARQALYLNQEAVEGAALTDIFNDVDFHGYRPTNIGTAVNPGDAVSLAQYQADALGAGVARDEAEAARDIAVAAVGTLDATAAAAAASAASASGSASTATTQAGIATAAAATATTQAGIATTQAGIATTQAGIATVQASAAAASAAAAAANAPLLLESVAGTNTITATTTPDTTAYAAGQLFKFIAVNDNTGPATINVDGVGAAPITKNGTEALSAGDIQAGQAYLLLRDAVGNFQLSGGAGGGAQGGGVFYLANQVLADDYTIPANTNAITGSFSIATGKTLTIGSGSTVSIV